jgi:shikimate dehydrogenase
VTPDGRTRLYAVLGRPIAHSLSPALHNAAFRAEARNAVYVACEVGEEQLAGALTGLAALGAAGVNLTAPLKERALTCGLALTDEARAAGAVNTVRLDGTPIGHNTDGEGLARFLERHGVTLAGARVVFLGAGGAVRGIAPVLDRRGVESIAAVVRHARPAIPGVEFAHEPFAIRAALARATLVVQATPLGASADDPLPAPAEWVPQAATAVDLRYHPAATPWLLAVRARGVRAANGLGMLIEQALLAQEFWHDTTPPRTALEEAVEWSDPFAP